MGPVFTSLRLQGTGGWLLDTGRRRFWYDMSEAREDRYRAAGGVVAHHGRVMVLSRPGRGEIRLPKGHIEPGEDARATALRETREESGYAGLVVVADLGVQVVSFEHEGRHVVRTERYFLMDFEDHEPSRVHGEDQFEPVWLSWDEAPAALTFEPEREWLRRARAALGNRQGATEGGDQ